MNKKIIFLSNIDRFFVSHRLPIAKQLLLDGYEVYIATEYTTYQKKLIRMGFKTYNIKFNRNSMNLFKMFVPFFQILTLLVKIKPSILHLISIKPIILGGFLPFILPIKSVVISITGLGSLYIKKSFFFILRENILNAFLRVIFILPNLNIILQNRSDLNYLIKKTGLKKNKVKIIKGSGVDLEKFKFSRITYKIPKILMASRIIEDKGVLEFIKAASYLKKKKFKAKFYLIGDVDKANPSVIHKKTVDNWIKNKLVNYVDHQQNIEMFIKRSAIVVLPSYREGFPKILMEAAAIGRPVITTNVPGCRDAVIRNVTGILVPVKNYIALAKSIEKLCKNKKKLKKIGIAARKHAIKNFNVTDIVAQHISIYKKII